MAIYGSDLNNANKNTCESFCHKPANNLGAAVLATFPPVNPFADFRGQMNLAQFVIFTNVNAATYPGANNAPKNSNMKAQFSRTRRFRSPP